MTDQPLDRYLDDFGRELHRARNRSRLGRPFLGRRSPRGPLVALGALVVAGSALAASGILTGSAVKDPYGAAVPTEGTGAAIVSSARLTALRVDDPAGGLPWGLQVARTTRGAGCVQVGRVRDGRLGVLGQDGAFRDDGLFHPLGPEVTQAGQCQPLDAAGKLYLAVSYQGMPASAWPRACATERQVRAVAEMGGGRHPDPRPTCPPDDLRLVYYGTLGPQATAVTYREPDGRRVTARTSGRDGAYLVVTRPSRIHPATGYSVPAPSPLSGLVSVRYRDGHVCRIPNPRRLGGARPCPMVGYAARPRPTATDVARPVTATFSKRPRHPREGPPPGTPSPEAYWVLKVSFPAPVATPDASLYYVVFLSGSEGPATRCRSLTEGPIARSLRRGERATATFFVGEPCHGRVTGDVRLHRSNDGRTVDQMPFSPRDTRGDPVVGSFAATIPHR